MARSVPCFAFIVFQYREDAEDAQRRADGEEICGRRIRVTVAKPRIKNRSSGGRDWRSFDPNCKCYQCGDKVVEELSFVLRGQCDLSHHYFRATSRVIVQIYALDTVARVPAAVEATSSDPALKLQCHGSWCFLWSVLAQSKDLSFFCIGLILVWP